MSGWREVKNADALGQNWADPKWDKARIDPYLIWAALGEFKDAGGKPGDWISVILELDITAKAFAAKMAALSNNHGANQWIKIDPLYSNPPSALNDTTFCTALVRQQFFANLQLAPLRKLVKRFEVALAMVPESFVAKFPPAPPVADSYTEPADVTCVVGIIDDGIGFAHKRFRDSKGNTRIDYLWDQGYFDPSLGSTMYGRELTNGNINALMTQSRSSTGTVDEDAVYRLAYYDEVRRRFAHGTFVLDTACGMEPKDVTDATPRIVAVQLQSPSRRTRDRGTGWLNARTLDGLRYILDRSTKIKKNACPPVVVNLSYGLTAGPHDGSSVLECAMDELIRLGKKKKGIPLNIVVAAGNSNLRRTHAQFEVPAGKSNGVCWRSLPNDPTPNFMEIWLPAVAGGGIPKIQVRAKPPTTNHSVWIPLNTTYAWQSGANLLCTVTSRCKVATGERAMILIALAPTAPVNGSGESAPGGTWEVEIKNDTSADIEIHAWIQRDETPYTFPLFGRQSHFADPNYLPFDDQGHTLDIDPSMPPANKVFIYRKNTLNSIATGEETIVIGGYRRSDGIAARYSSSGPKLNVKGAESTTLAIKAVAVSDDSPVTRGILAAGARSSSTVAINGTSVSAPQIVRWVTDRIIAGQAHDRQAVCDEADNQEGVALAGRPALLKNPAFDQTGYGPKLPKIRGGQGRVELKAQRDFESGYGRRPR